ncbi:hypothetical protein QWY85_17110 [Neolewinella lacunae]|uniref:Uncharacterized protein n=1 Tax=Neolewinella lacunae TaxID=1517758 RepID=A0A923PM38_9BACT|nr:hypothetical protein [Neolewinella lacunae]MBC6993693.1 hypothetical protein [Neolewinella lacunae]MDN3636388.1 hypothetical protein [Neolewinella lacunae]
MNFIIWILSAINIYFGMKNFLNVINVLQDTKYSQSSTAVFAVLFLGMGIGGLYLFHIQHNSKLALWLELGPWVLALLVLLFTMATSKYN